MECPIKCASLVCLMIWLIRATRICHASQQILNVLTISVHSPSSRLPNVSMKHIINIIAVSSPLDLQLDATILVVVIVIFYVRIVIVVVASLVDKMFL